MISLPCRCGEHLARVDRARRHGGEIRHVHLEMGDTGVVPRDLEQVRQQRLEAVEFGLEQFGRPGELGREGVTLRVQELTRPSGSWSAGCAARGRRHW